MSLPRVDPKPQTEPPDWWENIDPEDEEC